MSKDREKEIQRLIYLKSLLIKETKKEIKTLQLERKQLQGEKKLERGKRK